MSNNRVIIWVDPEFKKMLKKDAAENNETMIKYTRTIVNKRKCKKANIMKDIGSNKNGGLFW